MAGGIVPHYGRELNQRQSTLPAGPD